MWYDSINWIILIDNYADISSIYFICFIFHWLWMSTLSITRGPYEHRQNIFEYEEQWFMTGGCCRVEVTSYWTVEIIESNDDGETLEKKVLDKISIEKIKKIIEENIEDLATMWWLEWEPECNDWWRCRFFFWWDSTSIDATIINLWEFQHTYRNEDDEDEEDTEKFPFTTYDKEGNKVTAKNVTKIMNIYYKIRNILIENWVDASYLY